MVAIWIWKTKNDFQNNYTYNTGGNTNNNYIYAHGTFCFVTYSRRHPHTVIIILRRKFLAETRARVVARSTVISPSSASIRANSLRAYTYRYSLGVRVRLRTSVRKRFNIVYAFRYGANARPLCEWNLAPRSFPVVKKKKEKLSRADGTAAVRSRTYLPGGGGVLVETPLLRRQKRFIIFELFTDSDRFENVFNFYARLIQVLGVFLL